MNNVKIGQKVYILVDADEFGNYSKLRTDIVVDIYSDEDGTPTMVFKYLPCDIAITEVGVSVFTDEEVANKELRSNVIRFNAVLQERKNKQLRTYRDRYKAVYSITANLGIGIIDFEYGIDDYCINEYFCGSTVKRSKNKIYTDENGRQYIKKRIGALSKCYLDEFLRTDI